MPRGPLCPAAVIAASRRDPEYQGYFGDATQSLKFVSLCLQEIVRLTELSLYTKARFGLVLGTCERLPEHFEQIRHHLGLENPTNTFA